MSQMGLVCGNCGDGVGKGLSLFMAVVVLSWAMWLERAECSGNASFRADRERTTDPDLIRLYLEEFRMELLQMKSQLARMSRNSKLVQTTLKGLQGHRCSPSAHKLTDYAAIDCPNGFSVSTPTSCYKFLTERLTWGQAAENCKSLNAHLIRLETESEEKFITSHLTNTKKLRNCDFWTDATDIQLEGVWRWNSTGREVLRSKWYNGEPNNSNDQEHCAWLDWYFRWLWNDASCETDKACFVCEIEA